MNYLELISPAIAIGAALFTLLQAREAKKARDQMQLQGLFNGFDSANKATIDNPVLLKRVHGLDIDDDECRNIAYLSMLMDAFQHYSESELEDIDDYKSNFLDKITSLPENKEPWKIMKKIYYGDRDKEFTDMIDSKFG